jgi:RNA polymerase sigma-70 factor (ECF subfamily)
MTARSQPACEGIVDDDAASRVGAAYARHRARVYQLALRYGGTDPQWAEDVVQDVFVQLCRSIARLDDREDLGGWLYRVATNTCLSRLRRRAVREAPGVRWLLSMLGDARTPDDPERTSEASEQFRRLFARLERLPPRERVAFCMYHLDGREQKEIAEVLGVSKSGACKLIQRAEAKLDDEEDAP